MPLVPVTGHTETLDFEAHSLHDVVGFIHMGIQGEAKFPQSLDLGTDDMINEMVSSVLRHSACHPQLSCLIHHGPGHRGPLGSQQTEGGKGLDTVLNESLAPLIAAKMPEFIHQGSMCDIQG